MNPADHRTVAWCLPGRRVEILAWTGDGYINVTPEDAESDE